MTDAAPFVPRALGEILDEIEERMEFFDRFFGPDGDCGESCAFLTINDTTILVRHCRVAVPREDADAAR